MSKIITKQDYRYGLGDKYGRRKCGSCSKRRVINAHWKDTNKVLCKGCSIEPGKALSYSVRGRVS